MDETRMQSLEAVAEAAREYRAAMRRYINDQTRLLDAGMSLDEIMERNWGRFAETMRAKEQLYAILDALDAPPLPLSAFM